jgi:anti-sigma factor RsiW
MRSAGESDRPPEQCAVVAAQLDAYHDGLLPAEEKRAVASHVAGCSRCAARLEALAATDRLIRSTPAPRVGPELRQILSERIAMARQSQTPSAPIRSIRISETTMNDTGSELPRAAATHHSPRRLSIWLSGIAAALIVALLADVFLAQGHGPTRPGPTRGSGNTPTTTAGACAPSAIQANLPAHASLNDLTMTSATDGWAVGGVRESSSVDAPTRTLILHFSACHWTEVGPSVPGTSLTSISMDSPTDGWITGPTYTTSRVLLHYTGGQWHRVADPIAASAEVTYMQIRMLSPTDGWLVASGSVSANDPGGDWLLHYHNGAWTRVDAPNTQITDIAPVGPDELWVVGHPNGPDQRGGILAHYLAGKWTIPYHAPGYILLSSIRMLSPTDGWATGEAYPVDDATGEANYFEGYAKPAILRYDGTTWRGISPTNPHAQRVSIFGDDEAWAFQVVHRTSDPDPINLTISLAQYEDGGWWRTVKMPANDFSSILALSRVSAGEYWAIGTYQTYQAFTPLPGSNGGGGGYAFEYPVLLHFANGIWTQYGR